MDDKIERLFSLAKKLENFGLPKQDSDDELHPFDSRNIHPEIANCCMKLFDNGHFSQAAFEAFKLIDKRVEKLSGISETGKKLMMSAFKESQPKIALNPLKTASEKNEQEGYKYIFAGSIVGIRNPRGHDVGSKDSLEECLDHLSLASLLMRILDDRVPPNHPSSTPK